MRKFITDRHIVSRIVLAALLLLSIVLYVAWGWSDQLTELGGDGAAYMLAARYFSPFHALDPVLSEYGKTIFYPPLFPLLVGTFGGGFLAAHLLVISALLASGLLLYLWSKDEFGVSSELAAWSVLVFLFLPGTMLTALNIWSENIFLFFSVLSIFAVKRAELDGATRQRFWTVAAIAVSAATLTRVAALPLLASFLIYLALRRPRQWLGYAALAITPFLIWLIWSQLTQTGISGYTTHWTNSYSSNPLTALANNATKEMQVIELTWRYAVVGGGALNGPLGIVASAFGLLGLFGLTRRLFGLHFDALYFVAYASMLLAWPHPEEALRYSYVIYPLLVVYAVPVLAHGVSATRWKDRAGYLAPCLLLVVTLAMLPAISSIAIRFLEKVPAEISESRHLDKWYSADHEKARQLSYFHHQMLTHLGYVAKLIPEGACVFSVKSTLVTLYTGRSSYPPPGIAINDSAFATDIARCRYAYVVSIPTPSTGGRMLYPLARLGERARVISAANLEMAGGATTVGALIEILPGK